MKPICFDGYCGLGGWSEGFLAEGWDVTGFDIEAHEYGDQRYPGKLVLRDMLTVHGSELKDAHCLVMSPPCQAYSYMAMPWSRAKAIAAEYRSGVRNIDDLNALFNACFRIQREACEAAGRYIPMVVENVKGAQPWVGPAKAHYGSFYLWGDVEMVGDRIIAGGLKFDGIRAAKRGRKNDGGSWFAIAHNTTSGTGNNARDAIVEDGRKVPGMNFHDFAKTGKPGRSFQSAAVDGMKTTGHVNKRDGHTHTRHLTNQRESDDIRIAFATGKWPDAVKNGGDWFGSGADCSLQRKASSKSDSRKAASAQIAKIPFPLSSYIARSYRPLESQ